MRQDQFTTLTQKSWFDRLKGSIGGILFGILLFLASFFVLYTNEGRVDFGEVAKGAIEIAANNPAPEAQGELVSVTGEMTTSETLGDSEYLKPEAYLAFWREVEMFSWRESSTSDTQRNTGGSTTTETTYTYSKTWSSNPQDSNSFEQPEEHQNPPLTLRAEQANAQTLQIGQYALNPDRLTLPKPAEPLALTPETVYTESVAIRDGYLFQGEGTLDNPEIGDLRIQYYALPSGTEMTIFGELAESQIVPHVTKKRQTFYRALLGTRPEAIAQLKRSHKFAIWAFRIVGFFMMWFGLMLIAEPLGIFLDFFPWLGNIFRGISGIATFGISLILWSITVIISILLHNLIALAIAVIVALLVWGGIKRFVLRPDAG